ncbi:MAG: hypothetical protein ACK52K_18200 [Alphaproteobacteria bacterium]|jgi:glycosyltransferase involved in cell wall biosynthesis
MLRKLELYSPIPPMKTGTAAYFSKLVDSLREARVPAELVSVVIDSDQLDLSERTNYRGYELVDYRIVPDLVDGETSRIYFVANNEYHSYVHKSLSRVGCHSGGRVISVVHDPSCSMILKSLCSNGVYGFSPDQFQGLLEVQYGNKARKLIDDSNAGFAPNVFDYVTHAQRNTIERSDEIWTHSVFGALKLVLESHTAYDFLPTFRIGAHPVMQSTSPPGVVAAFERKGGTFRIGVFGWVSRAKRLVEVIRGVALALDRLPPDAPTLELLIVGKLPPAEELDVIGECRKHDIERNAILIDYAPDSMFAHLVGTCDLVFNLRYPSCGETSGTLAHANGYKVRSVVSAYQAFHEEVGALQIPIQARLEEFFVAGIVCDAIEKMSESPLGRNDAPLPIDAQVCPIDRLIMLELLGEFS